MAENEMNCRRRVDSTRRFLSIIVSVAVLLPLWTKAEEDMNCLHKYTEQLNPFPNCNPYNRGIMILECTAEVPLNESDITIGWFLDCEQLTNSTNVTIQPQVFYSELNDVLRIRSRLTINGITDDYAGDYTCNILGEDEYIPSDLFTLHNSEKIDIRQALGPCDDGHVFLHPADEKCADITDNTTIPMSLSCEEPPATSSHSIPVTSTPVIQTTPPPSLPTSSSSQTNILAPHSTSFTLFNTPSPTPTLPPSLPTSSSSQTNILAPHSTSFTLFNTPAPTPTPPVVTSDAQPSTTPSVILYAVVALAALLFATIIVLFVVFVVMCRRQPRGVDRSEVTAKSPVHDKQLTSPTRMSENTMYEGDTDTPGDMPDDTIANTSPLRGSDAYNTIGIGDYETVGPGSDYQRLQRPSATPSMRPRFMTSPDHSAFSPTSTVASMYPLSTTTLNEPNKGNGGIVPPPLPSTARRGNMVRLPNSPDSPDSAFNTGSVDLCSPSDRDRFDSSSMLLPKDRKESASEFEGLYTHRVQRATGSPGTNHPLQNIPETGASFPEPSNPHPFPTYEVIPGHTACSKHNVKGYEKPLRSPKSGRTRAVTLPVRSPPPISPPPSENDSRQYNTQQVRSSDGRAATISPRHPQEKDIDAISGPIYHSLEPTECSIFQRDEVMRVLTNSASSAPVVETADLTDSSTSNTLTPAFPVCSADFAEFGSGSAPKSNSQKTLRTLSNDYSPDVTGDSDYPQTTNCTGGSSTSAYAESDWTGGAPNGNGRAFTGDFYRGLYTEQNTMSPGHSNSSTSSNHTPKEVTSNRPYNGGMLNGDMSKRTIPNGKIVSNVPMPNGGCAIIAQYPHRVPAGSSHTVPIVTGPANLNGPESHTLSTPRNHYKALDPSTMEPHLKYTTLNVGKLTVV